MNQNSNMIFSVAMYYLKKNYNFSLLDFKLYRPNLITNDGYINHHQKVHRAFKIKFPKIIITLSSSSTEKKELYQVIRKKLLNEINNNNLFYL